MKLLLLDANVLLALAWPDEYYVIESANPKIQDFDGATMSFVEYLFELTK